MACKWEYKFILRKRSVGHSNVSDWEEAFEDGKSLGKSADLSAVTKKLGDDGWELVSIAPRSSIASHSNMPTGGVTSEELWVFKRSR